MTADRNSIDVDFAGAERPPAQMELPPASSETAALNSLERNSESDKSESGADANREQGHAVRHRSACRCHHGSSTAAAASENGTTSDAQTGNARSESTDRQDRHSRRVAAPKRSGQLLMEPDRETAAAWIEQNAKLLSSQTVRLGGKTLAELRQWTRSVLWQEAVQYVSHWRPEYRTQPPILPQRLIVTGHQPALTHPGVWAKNFVAGALAREQVSAGAINLIVDNDTRGRVAIAVPGGTHERPVRNWMAYDQVSPARPWEEVSIEDPEQFASFGTRVQSALAAWGVSPLIEEFWPLVLEQARTLPRVSDQFSAARNRLEQSWGCYNLELPLSRVCVQQPFFWFVAALLGQMPKFWSIYNSAVTDYRQENRIRNQRHPVPDLQRRTDEQGAEWLESPFWIWREGDTRRQRLWTRTTSAGVELATSQATLTVLKVGDQEQTAEAVAALEEMSAAGWKLRTRALTTTLFHRLCLADLFIHGIGGAKYDAMTDRIMFDLWGIVPPQFVTVTATVHLPLGAHPVELADLHRGQREYRDLLYQPEQFLSADQQAVVAPLLAEKQALIEEQRLAEHWRCRTEEERSRVRQYQGAAGRRRFHRLQEIKHELGLSLESQRRAIEEKLQLTQSRLQANQILNDREYAFCLYPRELIERCLKDWRLLPD